MNESIYSVPIVYDDYGLLINQGSDESVNEIPTLIVGFQNLVFHVQHAPDMDDVEIEINEGDTAEEHMAQPCESISILRRIQELYESLSVAIGNFRSSVGYSQ